MLSLTAAGLYCEAGDFHVDPWSPVDRAVITHAHADHARQGSRSYLLAAEGRHVARRRLGDEARIETLEWGESRVIDGVSISLHPAGHILGSAQVRLEHRGEIWVASGDYKSEPDPTCASFEPVVCHTFITESTFGLPIYRWPRQELVMAQIDSWWRANREAGRASILYAYSLGKAQRVLAGIDASIGPIFTHGAVEALNEAYRKSGIELPPTTYVGSAPADARWDNALIVAPPSAHGSAWMRRFGPSSTGFCSGWMRIRGARRRRSVDRGFVLSDHVDWPALLETIDATGAQKVLVTHGYRQSVVRYLREQGLAAEPIADRFEGEQDNDRDGAGESTANENEASA